MRRIVGWVTFILFISILGGASSALAEARIALLIGNQGYSAKVGPLKNPHNDVNLIEASLKQLGFKVTVLKDANYKAMDSALKRHVTEVRRAGRETISFFYYSGHGVANPETQINYLIPIDVADADDDRVWFESFQQTAIIDLLSREAPNATHYVVFDACRNELKISGTAVKALGMDKGFVPVMDTAGLLIAYATAPRKTASDVGESGGPYAKALAEELVKPGVEAVTMFRNVQIRVKQAIGQDPWLSFPSLPPVFLAGKPGASASLITGAAQVQLNEAAEAWNKAKDTTDMASLEGFIRRFGNTYYGDLAKARLEAMNLYKTAYAAMNAKDYDRAIAGYSKAIELDPKYALAYYNRGFTHAKKEDYDRAITDYDKAIELNPRLAFAYNSRGLAIANKQDYDRAIADLNKAIEIDPRLAYLYYNRGLIYKKKEDYDRAIADYNKAIELDPKDANFYRERSVSYLSKKDYDRAIADNSKAIELDPKFVSAHNDRGVAYQMKGDSARAIADYRKALELDPLYGPASENLKRLGLSR